MGGGCGTAADPLLPPLPCQRLHAGGARPGAERGAGGGNRGKSRARRACLLRHCACPSRSDLRSGGRRSGGRLALGMAGRGRDLRGVLPYHLPALPEGVPDGPAGGKREPAGLAGGTEAAAAGVAAAVGPGGRAPDLRPAAPCDPPAEIRAGRVPLCPGARAGPHPASGRAVEAPAGPHRLRPLVQSAGVVHVRAGQPGHGAALRRGRGAASGAGQAEGVRPDADLHGGEAQRPGTLRQRVQPKRDRRKDTSNYETQKALPRRHPGGGGTGVLRGGGLRHLGSEGQDPLPPGRGGDLHQRGIGPPGLPVVRGL